MIRICVVLFCLFIPASLFADSATPDIRPYGRASLNSEKAIASAGHLVLFSAVREVNDEIRSSSMARLSVQGVGQLWEIGGDAGRADARGHYRDVLQARDARILFDCEGRECGRSNVWANRIFGESKLYGRDENQDYLVAVHTDEDGTVWLTLVYTVTRGNQREYLWVEHLAVEPGTVIPGIGLENQPFRGPVIVPWEGGVTFRFDWSADDRRRLQEWSEAEKARVLLVSHTAAKQGEPVSDAMERARKAADALAMLLARSGISEDKQQQVIVGPAVPLGDPQRSGNRIELLVFER